MGYNIRAYSIMRLENMFKVAVHPVSGPVVSTELHTASVKALDVRQRIKKLD